MFHIETLYIGCKDSGEIVQPESSHCIRLCSSNVFAHATLISQFCPAFTQAQLQYQEGTSDKPYQVSVIFPFDMDHKRKKEDTETTYERVKWYAENLAIPSNGIIISFYQNTKVKSWITEPWYAATIWPTRRENEPQDYVTIQRTELLIGGTKKYKVIEESRVFEDTCVKLCDKLGIKYKFVDYSMPMNETYKIMLGSQMHFTYAGATYYFAGLMNLPTISWCFPNKKRIKGNYYHPEKCERVTFEIENSYWANTRSARGLSPKFIDGEVINYPTDYIKHVDNVQELELEMLRIL